MYKHDPNKNSLENMLGLFEAHSKKSGFLVLVVKLPNQDTPQLIIDSTKSAEVRSNYLKNDYNPDLTLKLNTEIKILKYGWFDTLADMEELLFEEDEVF